MRLKDYSLPWLVCTMLVSVWFEPVSDTSCYLMLFFFSWKEEGVVNGALPRNDTNIQSKWHWNQERELWCVFWTCQWYVSWFRVTIFPEGRFNVPIFFPKCWIYNLEWLLGSVSIYLWKHCLWPLELICLRCHVTELKKIDFKKAFMVWAHKKQIEIAPYSFVPLSYFRSLKYLCSLGSWKPNIAFQTWKKLKLSAYNFWHSWVQAVI